MIELIDQISKLQPFEIFTILIAVLLQIIMLIIPISLFLNFPKNKEKK